MTGFDRVWWRELFGGRVLIGGYHEGGRRVLVLAWGRMDWDTIVGSAWLHVVRVEGVGR